MIFDIIVSDFFFDRILDILFLYYVYLRRCFILFSIITVATSILEFRLNNPSLFYFSIL